MGTIIWVIARLYLLTSCFHFAVLKTDPALWLDPVVKTVDDHLPFSIVDTLSQYETLRWGMEIREWDSRSWESSQLLTTIKDFFMLDDLNHDIQIGTIWPWEELGDNLIDYSSRHRQFYEHLPVRTIYRCPICHRRLHEAYYRSPDWTWRSLCGNEGELIYCPHCKIQWQYHCIGLN